MARQRWCNEKARSRLRDSERRTGTGSPTEMEAAGRLKEWQQKEGEGAGQRPKKTDGGAGQRCRKKTCSITETEERRIEAGTQTKRDREIEQNRHGESSRSVTCYGAEKEVLESRDKEPDRERQRQQNYRRTTAQRRRKAKLVTRSRTERGAEGKKHHGLQGRKREDLKDGNKSERDGERRYTGAEKKS